MPDEIQGGSTETPPTGNETPAPKYLTAEDVGQIVNSAITSHLKRSLGKSIEEALKPIQEQMKASAAPAPPAKEVVTKSPEYAALEQQIENLKRVNEETAARAVAAERKQREDRAFADIKSSLAGQVRPEFLDVVAHNLFTVQKRVDFEEDGTPVLTGKRSTVYGEEDVRLPIKNGIEEYLKSPEAKAFLNAPGTSSATPKPKHNAHLGQQPFDPEKASFEEKLRHSMAMEANLQNQGIG